MTKKERIDSRIKVALIFGGMSTEHSISCLSAASILKNIDREKYQVFAIGITKEGNWHRVSDNPDDWQKVVKKSRGKQITILPEVKAPKFIGFGAKKRLAKCEINFNASANEMNVDVVFPVLHGIYGEDGTIQGLFEMFKTPLVGCSITCSSNMQDKHFAKVIFKDANLNTSDWVTLKVNPQKVEISDDDVEAIAKLSDNFKTPLFVKPSRAGSSFGVNKITEQKQLQKAVELAAKFDSKVIIEKEVKGREIECAILQTRKKESPFEKEFHVSTLGEIITQKGEFYDYETKYSASSSAKLRVKPPMDKENEKRLKEVALEAFKAADCEGIARVDMFLTPKGDVYMNEINTLPGFTEISMYPTLLQNDGFEYTEIISKLIEEARLRPKFDVKTKTVAKNEKEIIALFGGVLR